MIQKIKPASILACLLFMTISEVFSQPNFLQFRNGSFKIVQFTDTHIKANRKESQVSISTIQTVLDIENPDLVIFTGDVVVARPVFKGWEMVLKPCIDRDIPYAVVFGNHDDEHGISREMLADSISKMPYSLLQPRVEGVYGFGNYVLELHASDSERIVNLLYCIDSNAYSINKKYKGYGWIMPSQIDWYQKESRHYAATQNAVLPALAFFHIPLPEYSAAFFDPVFINKGYRNENECSPEFNSGMFNTMVKCGDVMATFAGHDHVNDYIAYKEGIALAYGRFTGSTNTYGSLDCGARVIEMHEGQRSFTTWIRTGNGIKLQVVNYPYDFIPANKEILTLE